jgi:hypothetical protein
MTAEVRQSLGIGACESTAKENQSFLIFIRAILEKIGGADRDRTDDLLIANEALSQLSYSPTDGSAGIVALGRRRPASRALNDRRKS